MQLSIDSLKQMGAFTGAPVEREITWKQVWFDEDEDGNEIPGTRVENDHTATVYVRPLSYLSARADLAALTGKTDGVAGRIAACICDEKGRPVFTVDDIVKGPIDPATGEHLGPLDGNLSMALLAVIGEVNGRGKTPS